MNINQLKYFIQVAELLNFTKAAEKCFISQTAMTQQIRSLENNIGVPLLVRDKHHVELTAAGRVYLEEARAIVRKSDEALVLARLASEGLHGEITIGYMRGCSQSEIAQELRGFYKTHPNVKINFIRDNMSVLMEMLEQGQCDLVIAVNPSGEALVNLEHRYLDSYPVMAAMDSEHPLASRDSITYKELKDEKFIMMQPANRPKDQMEESMLIYKNGGFLPNVVAVEGDPETLMLMISIGLGISILPEYITSSYKDNKGVRILPMLKEDGSAEVVDMAAWWKKDSTNMVISQVVSWLTTFSSGHNALHAL